MDKGKTTTGIALPAGQKEESSSIKDFELYAHRKKSYSVY